MSVVLLLLTESVVYNIYLRNLFKVTSCICQHDLNEHNLDIVFRV